MIYSDASLQFRISFETDTKLFCAHGEPKKGGKFCIDAELRYVRNCMKNITAEYDKWFSVAIHRIVQSKQTYDLITDAALFGFSRNNIRTMYDA